VGKQLFPALVFSAGNRRRKEWSLPEKCVSYGIDTFSGVEYELSSPEALIAVAA
jgi:hypothetical protein